MRPRRPRGRRCSCCTGPRPGTRRCAPSRRSPVVSPRASPPATRAAAECLPPSETRRDEIFILLARRRRRRRRRVFSPLTPTPTLVLSSLVRPPGRRGADREGREPAPLPMRRPRDGRLRGHRAPARVDGAVRDEHDGPGRPAGEHEALLAVPPAQVSPRRLARGRRLRGVRPGGLALSKVQRRREEASQAAAEVRSISHWFPYDRVGVVNADR